MYQQDGCEEITNDNIINTITQYIKNIPLDAYSVGQKNFHQNSNY
jgi:hypothetical protein